MGGKPTPLASRVEPTLDATAENIPAEAAGKTPLLIRWTGFLTAAETGDYKVGLLADGFSQVTVVGKPVAMNYLTNGAEKKLGRVHLEKGKKVELAVQYGQMGQSKVRAQLIWSPVDLQPMPEALAAARDADVVVAVVGITSQLEGEEFSVFSPLHRINIEAECLHFV